MVHTALVPYTLGDTTIMIDASEMPAMPSPLLKYIMGGLAHRLNISPSKVYNIKSDKSTSIFNPPVNHIESNGNANDVKSVEQTVSEQQSKLNIFPIEEDTSYLPVLSDFKIKEHGTVKLVSLDHMVANNHDSILNKHTTNQNSAIEMTENGNRFNELSLESPLTPPDLNPLTVAHDLNSESNKEHVNDVYSGVSIKHLIEDQLNPVGTEGVNRDPVYENIQSIRSGNTNDQTLNRNTIEEIQSSINKLNSHVPEENSNVEDNLLNIIVRRPLSESDFLIGKIGSTVEISPFAHRLAGPIGKLSSPAIKANSKSSNFDEEVKADDEDATANEGVTTVNTNENETESPITESPSHLLEESSSEFTVRTDLSEKADIEENNTTNADGLITTEVTQNEIIFAPETVDKHEVFLPISLLEIINSDNHPNKESFADEKDEPSSANDLLKDTNDSQNLVDTTIEGSKNEKLARYEPNRQMVIDSLEEQRLMDDVRKIVQSLKYDETSHSQDLLSSILNSTTMSYHVYPTRQGPAHGQKLPSTAPMKQAPHDKLPSTGPMKQAPQDKLPSTGPMKQAPQDKLPSTGSLKLPIASDTSKLKYQSHCNYDYIHNYQICKCTLVGHLISAILIHSNNYELLYIHIQDGVRLPISG